MAWFRSKYVQLLERENARLLEENRKLLNTVLPRLGYDPLDPRAEQKPPQINKKNRRPSFYQWAVGKMRDASKVPTEIVLPRPDRKGQNGDASKPAENVQAGRS
jgi:hypothetical protein